VRPTSARQTSAAHLPSKLCDAGSCAALEIFGTHPSLLQEMKMTISRNEVIKIAELAKLTLSEDEINMFQGQLSDILNYAAVLQQVDTTNIPPTTSAIPLRNVMRADNTIPSLENEAALFNAPDSDDRSFRVKAVLD
jgi:aspartyl-tRNA(Asn)/glutamyl-tRNA(Gln) amidotransferase subunit C